MQIAIGGRDFHFHVRQPAQAVGDGGDAAGELVGVADDRDVGLEGVLVLVHEGAEIPAADFLLVSMGAAEVADGIKNVLKISNIEGETKFTFFGIDKGDDRIVGVCCCCNIIDEDIILFC